MDGAWCLRQAIEQARQMSPWRETREDRGLAAATSRVMQSSPTIRCPQRGWEGPAEWASTTMCFSRHHAASCLSGPAEQTSLSANSHPAAETAAAGVEERGARTLAPCCASAPTPSAAPAVARAPRRALVLKGLDGGSRGASSLPKKGRRRGTHEAGAPRAMAADRPCRAGVWGVQREARRYVRLCGQEYDAWPGESSPQGGLEAALLGGPGASAELRGPAGSRPGSTGQRDRTILIAAYRELNTKVSEAI